ncbi:MAG: hypothetical protein AB1632_14845 [Nitrospirota bacterium]
MAEKDEKIGKKELFEVLLEKVYGEVKRVSEGHDIVIKNIEEVRQEGRTNKEELVGMIKFSNKVLHEKIDNVKTELSQRIDKVEQKIDNVKTELSQRIDNVEQKLSHQIEKVEQKVNKLDEKMTKRQDEIEGKVDTVYQKVIIGH